MRSPHDPAPPPPMSRGASALPALDIEALHHVSLPVHDLQRSRRFYEDVMGLLPIERPAFDFAGAWYAIGTQALHLIEGAGTYRGTAPVDSRDVHFAIRVRDFAAAVERLRRLGYTPEAADATRRTRESPAGRAGFPQCFVLDPDHHVIEINARA